MRKFLFTSLFLILISCSSDSADDAAPPENPGNAFELSLDLERSVFGIDERIVINASSDETLSRGCIIFPRNEGDFSRCLIGGVENGFQVNLSFQTIGTKTFIIEAQTSDGEVSREERQIEIDSITNTVSISRVTLNSFPNQGGAFDPGFSDTDPERLADLFFQIEKRFVEISVGQDGPRYNSMDLPISEIHENESSLEWNFEGNELRFSRDNILFFKLFEFDEAPGMSEQFTNLFVNFGDYASEKPSQITVDNFGGSVEVTFDLVWN